MSFENVEEKESKNILFSTSFWVTVFISYITLVTGIWGFVEAYTYFQDDSLKNAIGAYWIGIYLIPMPIAFIIGIVRSRKKQYQPNDKVSDDVKQKVRSKSYNARGDFITFKGLLWESTRFGFRLPTPLCPRNNCKRPVNHERKYPQRYLVSSNPKEMQEFLNKQNTYRNIYSCPVHGELREVPDIELENLKKEAQFELKR